MKNRVLLPDFNMLWNSHIKQSTAPRMSDDREEEEFWRKFMQRKSGYAPDPSSRQVIEKLLPLLESSQIETALEIGPGWGNYTLDLAKYCREVTCVDISQDVLDFILRIGAEQGCYNIHPVHVKWEEYTPERKFDLVFGYNCFYRQADLTACFSRMNETAGKLCVVGMNTGLAPEWVHELEQAGGQVAWEWKDYIYFVGVLYQMGIDPNVMILPFDKEISYADKEALIRGECARCKAGTITPEAAGEILCRHFTQKADGSWYARAHYRSGVVWWTPV